MSLLRQFAGQTIIYGLGHSLSRILYFLIVTIYLANRLEGTAEFSLFGYMYGYATLLIVLLSYRIDTAFFRFGSKEGSVKEAFSSAFFPLVLTTVVLSFGIIFFSENIASLFKYESYPHYFRWFAVIIGLDVLSLLPFGKLRLENRAKTFMLLRIANIILSIFLILYFLEIYIPANPDGGWLKQIFPSLSLEVGYVFIANMIASLFLFIALLFTVGKIPMKIDWSLWKKMAWYSAPLIIVGIANSINQYLSPIIQNFFLEGTAEQRQPEIGMYNFSLRIASLLVMFNTAFNYAAEPFFFKNAANRNDKNIYRKVLSLYAICAVVTITGLIFFVDLLKPILGSDFTDGFFVIPILLIAFFMLGIYYNISIWYKLADKNLYGGLISVIGVCVTLTISIVLLPQMGVSASAWSTLACYTIMVLLALHFGKKHYPIEYDLKKLLSLLALALFMIILAMGIERLQLSLPLALLIKTILFIAFGFLLYKQNRSLLLELKNP